mmetsp:Transcript_17841/g.44637  ORF Transcript_17841/g.44637 Transcript_17841/m.44637 type:complete len:226 (-) Transcript_17841:926-1603(-)
MTAKPVIAGSRRVRKNEGNISPTVRRAPSAPDPALALLFVLAVLPVTHAHGRSTTRCGDKAPRLRVPPGLWLSPVPPASRSVPLLASLSEDSCLACNEIPLWSTGGSGCEDFFTTISRFPAVLSCSGGSVFSKPTLFFISPTTFRTSVLVLTPTVAVVAPVPPPGSVPARLVMAPSSSSFGGSIINSVCPSAKAANPLCATIAISVEEATPTLSALPIPRPSSTE